MLVQAMLNLDTLRVQYFGKLDPEKWGSSGTQSHLEREH
jgi:hypothetical protein